MNDDRHTVDDAWLDRLVDDELSADQRRQLLVQLESSPDGWRRCALAFLEAQAWRHDLSAIATTSRTPHVASKKPSASSPATSQPLRWRSWLAIAASWLAAFAMGLGARGAWSPPATPVEPQPWQAPHVVQHPDIPPAEPPFSPVGDLHLVVGGRQGEPARIERIPYYESSDALAADLQNQPPAIPDELIQELRRRGHRVERREEYLPVQLDDGRQVVIPLEGYQITPVSLRAY